MSELQAANGRLRVAVLNRVFSPTGGGAERYSIALVEQLASRHEIHVFAQTVNHSYPGVAYHLLPQFLSRPRWINQLWFALTSWWATRHGFDVVHSHENTWHGDVQTIHVVPIRFNLLQGRTGWERALRWFKIASSPRLLSYLWLEQQRYKEQPGRVLVVTSPSLLQVMLQMHPECQQLLQVVSPGVDAVPGPATLADRQAARRLLGLPLASRCVLFVANDFKKKGLACLLEALAPLVQVGELGEPVVLAVVGNPVHAAGFANQIETLGLKQSVFFLGSLTDVRPAYQAADCLVHPTLEDTFAMVVLEAMAHGLPVVVSAAPFCGIAGLLSDEVDALILQNPRDAGHLHATIRNLLQDPAQCQRLGEAATRFAQNHLWSQIALKQESIYLATQKSKNLK